jgi:hypothetical protein
LSDREGDEERETPVMRPNLRAARVPEEIEEGHRNAQTGCEIDQAAVRRGKGDGET